MSLLLTLLVGLIILGLCYWVAHKLIAAFGIPEPIGTLVDVALVIFAVLWLLGVLTGRVGPLIRI